MRMTTPTIAILTALSCASPAPADELEDMEKAMNLGTVLGAEEYCGLTFDQAAVAAFVEKTFPDKALGTAGQIALYTSAEQALQAERSESTKTAFCAAVTQTAQHNGFVAP